MNTECSSRAQKHGILLGRSDSSKCHYCPRICDAVLFKSLGSLSAIMCVIVQQWAKA